MFLFLLEQVSSYKCMSGSHGDLLLSKKIQIQAIVFVMLTKRICDCIIPTVQLWEKKTQGKMWIKTNFFLLTNVRKWCPATKLLEWVKHNDVLLLLLSYSIGLNSELYEKMSN